MFPVKFRLNPTSFLGEDVVWTILDIHRGYRNETILAILHLYFATMPHINLGSFRLAVWEEMSFEVF